ncbi:hypothetical protein ACFO0A_15235 [Novosphingobium tardum]|uniref:Uncharacterized protein n=1 Tax=Novosphingobium tardum TaxID=1538021 RepID=A0ABV8RTB7_9SPHN
MSSVLNFVLLFACLGLLGLCIFKLRSEWLERNPDRIYRSRRNKRSR